MKTSKKIATEIGIDIGGTKTHLRRYLPDGTAQDLILPTVEWRVRDWASDAGALLAIVEQFSGGTTIASMAVGAHGCDDAEECNAFQAAFAERVNFPVQVVNDAELLPAAFDLTDGIGVVAGTGSIAVCRNPDGRMLVAGGWGWVIGDEGSASGLMREAARAVALHLDYGGIPDEPLVQRLFEALDIKSAARIGSAIGRSGSAAQLGRHAHIIFEAAEAGSLLARQVVRDGAKELADLVARLKQNGAAATTVVAGGSVIASQPMLWSAFCEQIGNRFAGSVTARLFAGPPVEGACRLAARLNPTAANARNPVSSSS
ncbi:N-acetylglucosamine kinase [Aliirhizobium smilacinae]|uniref:Sugar kinase n=1 Tax=Aliirhizobium smilacinae TaxID=1395944 RepID=A0A5C4XLS7_9HYPH|nr:BadF/BadG/BcrA/BcrD ATPase family protein [Rhizobium smilacinae]TNM63801.1 sugar kinase [Rhizobium smilacinae]